MNKKMIVCLILTFCALYLLSGCNLAAKAPKPAETQSADSAGAAAPAVESPRYHYMLSRYHIKNNDLDKAIEENEKALALDPKSYLLTRDLIQLYLAKDDRAKALELAEALIIKNPQSVDGLLLFVQLKKDDITNAQLESILKKILELDPKNKESYLRLGRIYMQENNRTGARTLFKKMTQAFPDYYVGWYYLGEIYLIEKKYDLAEAAFSKTVELEPELTEPRFQMIRIYKALDAEDKYGKIGKLLKKIIEIDPENHRALMLMALNTFQSGAKKEASSLFTAISSGFSKDTSQAMAAYEDFIAREDKNDTLIVFTQLLETDPRSDTLNYYTAIAQQNVKAYEKAIELYGKVSKNHPEYTKSGLSIAFLYNEMEKPEKAIDFLKKRLKASPKDVDILSYLASFYEQQKKYDTALAILKEGLTHHPDSSPLLFRKGVIQDKAGLKKEALDTMARVIELDPDDASALNYLGYSLADQGIRLSEALSLIQKAYRLKPNDGYITDSLGWVYFKKGEFEKAVTYLEKAANLSNFQTIIADHLADAYVKVGRFEDALKTYQKALDNVKEDEDRKLVPAIKKKMDAIQKQINE